MELRKLINWCLLDEKALKKLNQRFSSAKSFKHVLIKDFLREEKVNSLLRALKTEEFIEKESDLFNFKQTSDLYFSKNEIIKNFHKTICSWSFFHLIEKITGVKLKGILDMSGTLYENCSYLLCHDDKLEGRKIAYVFYLSKNFTKKDGGDFVLFNSINNKPAAIAKKYSPLWNSLLLFEVSGNSFHEVEEILSNKKRYAIGGWFY